MLDCLHAITHNPFVRDEPTMPHAPNGNKPGYVQTQLTRASRAKVTADARLQGRDNRDVVSEACELYAEARPQLEPLCEQLDLSIPEAVRQAVAAFVQKNAAEAA